MGSFNVGCGMSNLSINEGDRVGFIILDNAEQYDDDGGKTMYCHTVDLYRPFLPPIFGTYDDYGSIANIDESPTTKVLEEMFNQPINRIIGCIGNTHGLYGSGILVPSPVSNEDDVSCIDFFVSLGMTKKEAFGDYVEVCSFDEYYFISSKKLSWGVIKRDDLSIVIPEENYYSHTFIYNFLDKFSSKTKVYPGFPEEKWEIIELLPKLSGMFFLEDVYKEMTVYRREELAKEAKWNAEEDERLKQAGKTPKERTPENATRDRIWSEFVDSVKNPDTMDLDPTSAILVPMYAMERLRQICSFPEKHLKFWAHYSSLYELDELKDFVVIMYSVSRMIMPSFNGEQFGNDKASLRLQRFTNNILEKRIAQQEEYDY